jgi:hypothetical protein
MGLDINGLPQHRFKTGPLVIWPYLGLVFGEMKMDMIFAEVGMQYGSLRIAVNGIAKYLTRTKHSLG